MFIWKPYFLFCQSWLLRYSRNTLHSTLSTIYISLNAFAVFHSYHWQPLQMNSNAKGCFCFVFSSLCVYWIFTSTKSNIFIAVPSLLPSFIIIFTKPESFQLREQKSNKYKSKSHMNCESTHHTHTQAINRRTSYITYNIRFVFCIRLHVIECYGLAVASISDNDVHMYSGYFGLKYYFKIIERGTNVLRQERDSISNKKEITLILLLFSLSFLFRCLFGHRTITQAGWET